MIFFKVWSSKHYWRKPEGREYTGFVSICLQFLLSSCATIQYLWQGRMPGIGQELLLLQLHLLLLLCFFLVNCQIGKSKKVKHMHLLLHRQSLDVALELHFYPFLFIRISSRKEAILLRQYKYISHWKLF